MARSFSARRVASSRGGFALITVLLVLMALLVLCAPFLMTSRNASKAATQVSDRTQARLALDMAVRHARGSLGGSHPSVDVTPYFDDADELTTMPELDRAFIDAHNANGVMWSSEIADIAAKIDLNSAPPQMFANLLGATNRLATPVKAKDKELTVSSTYGFPPTGYIWVGRELIEYGELDGSTFKKLVRGIGGVADEDGNAKESGPLPPSDHAAGTVVIDQRAYAPAMWRSLTKDGELREFDAPEQVRDSAQLAFGLALKPPEGSPVELVRTFERAVDDFVAPMLMHGTTYAGVRGGRTWQKPVRVFNAVIPGETGILQLDEGRWFSPGTTVQITDGQTTELAIVQGSVQGGIRLMEPLKNEYFAYTAELRALVRRPVNVNLASADVLEALFANVQMIGGGDRITRDEAQALAALVVESRPFTGMEDFLRRIVLPSAGLERLPSDAPIHPAALENGATLIDPRDAEALYRNALNANDSFLAYSTLPLSFTSRDVFQLSVRSVVNAQSGVERVTMVRDQVEMVVPQRDLLSVWARQEDFDEAFRLDREAPFWSTGPNALQRYDSGATPPSNFVPHFGTLGGQPLAPSMAVPLASASSTATPEEAPEPEHVFASREDTGWAQLWASREPDGLPLPNRFVEHFEHETRDPEGRFLPDEPWTKDTSDPKVVWTQTQSNQPLLRAFNGSFWFKPRDLSVGTLLDIGRTSLETDRVELSLETAPGGTDLVLRVYDGAGDLSNTAWREVGEARFAVQPGTGPGLLADTWSHVSFDVRGTRPSQITMLVDGRAYGVRKPGLTRLAAPLNEVLTQIIVESDEGFPDGVPFVVRIGNELIECVRSGANRFDATPQLIGANAGSGGRMARVRFTATGGTGGAPGIPDPNVIGNVTTNHPIGTPVELYGYSAPIASNVPAASAQLPVELGPWRVAMVENVVLGGSSDPVPGEPIIIMVNGTFGPFPFEVGLGIKGVNSQVTGLSLRSGDDPSQPAEMKAFSSQGGYALLMQRGTSYVDIDGARWGGFEIIRYSGFDPADSVLNIVERGVRGTGTFTNASGQPVTPNWTPRSFVVEFGSFFDALNSELDRRVFVAPISIPAPGGGGSFGFTDPQVTAQGSEFVQLTETVNAERTEWVRYDQVISDQLVRNDANALWELQIATCSGDEDPPPPTDPPGGPGSTGPAGIFSALLEPVFEPALSAISAFSSVPANPTVASTQGSQGSGYLWQAYWGFSAQDALSEGPLTKAARTNFQFRGVFGTFSHRHNSGTTVLPVWRMTELGVDRGEPGGFDHVVLMESDTKALGWPAEVHRTWRPLNYDEFSWQPNGLLAQALNTNDPPESEDFNILAHGAVWVALKARASAPMAPIPTVPGALSNLESRQYVRAMKHPSGERPREVNTVVLGGTIRGANIHPSLADEWVVGSTNLLDGQNTTPLQGASLILAEDLAPGPGTLQIIPRVVRNGLGQMGLANDVLTSFPQDAGLLRIGDEIICYASYDASTGTLSIPPSGRGLLGTIEANHEAGENAVFLDQFPVSVLTSSISPGEASLPIVDVDGFPLRGGTVIVGDELIHYTRIAGAALDMPRRSTKAGQKDNRGDGLFRGRYGSAVEAHDVGTPVILFPFRYWDRWTEKSDAPELSYYSLSLDQPNAFWRTAFWSAEEPGSGQVKIEVLQRVVNRGETPPPWDGEPGVTPGLVLLADGMPRGDGNPIARQGDLIEWRVHARFAEGAFDSLNGLAHGWKQTPRLRVFGSEYLGPNLVLRRVGQ